MDAHQRRRGLEVAHDQGDGLFLLRRSVAALVRGDGRIDALEAENAEMSPARREIRVGDLTNGGNGHTSIIEAWVPGLLNAVG
jgi:hypothetical protein